MYSDKHTGDILVAWTNSYTEKDNEVFPVANDPVNALLYPGVGMGYASFYFLVNFSVFSLVFYAAAAGGYSPRILYGIRCD